MKTTKTEIITITNDQRSQANRYLARQRHRHANQTHFVHPGDIMRTNTLAMALEKIDAKIALNDWEIFLVNHAIEMA